MRIPPRDGPLCVVHRSRQKLRNRIVKLRNRRSRDAQLLFNIATSVHASLCYLKWSYATLCFALGQATGGDILLSPSFVDDILFLNEPMERASADQNTAHSIR